MDRVGEAAADHLAPNVIPTCFVWQNDLVAQSPLLTGISRMIPTATGNRMVHVEEAPATVLAGNPLSWDRPAEDPGQNLNTASDQAFADRVAFVDPGSRRGGLPWKMRLLVYRYLKPKQLLHAAHLCKWEELQLGRS